MINKVAGVFGTKFTEKGKRFLKLALLIWAAFALVTFIASRLFAWGVCEWYGSETGRDVRYSAFIGCMVKVNDTWVPRSELRIVQ